MSSDMLFVYSEPSITYVQAISIALDEKPTRAKSTGRQAVTSKLFQREIIDVLPIGLMTLDADGLVREINETASRMLKIEIGANLAHKIHTDSLSDYDKLLGEAPGSKSEIQIRAAEDSIYTRLGVLSHGDGMTVLAVEDVSEVVALGSQLKNARQPERKFIHDLSNALTTTIGYTELIKMMLEEHEEFSGERLSAIRRYEGEVFEGLKRADELIRQRRQNAAQQVSAAVPLQRKHVLVVDDEPQITDFLTELLRARHYKVTAFTSGRSALEYYTSHHEQVDLVIMDQVMPEMSGISLATELLALDLHQPIVLCTGDQTVIEEQALGKLQIQHFLSKPIDINELTQMVSHIID